MAFIGILVFRDPPKADAQQAVASLARLGVTLKMITGDSAVIAQQVARHVGIAAPVVLKGEELHSVDDEALPGRAARTNVFAEIEPGQKERIIRALQRHGHVVGYMGDGINDAPALHAADVGISVQQAADAAKAAADIVLLEQDLGVLEHGVREGRRTFANTLKYVFMATSANFGNMFSMAAASIFLPFLPMLPTQILLNNFLYDLAQVTIPTDNVDAGFIRKPRHWNIKLIRDFMIYIGPISSIYDFLTFYAMLYVFKAREALFHTGWFVESLATQTLVLFIIRTAGNPLKSRPSPALATTTILVVFAGLELPFTPLASTLGFVPLPPLYFAFLGGVTLTYLLFVELVKRRVMSEA
jgi:Mg2+-importing ATPase